ncbi:hypothetical protein Fcan01_22820 [Folsomia candida]|uniref:Uncharacterized protein n=1 Tax=Folsomia candida TaxID=158441 RepID=A0A226DDV8_FOLCA|nr:hypothetical protein Fcan01_22820 [Folsomia candida]
MDTVSHHVEKLYQQLNILQEYIELKFGADFKDFENFKKIHPTKGKVVVTQDHVTTRFDASFPSPANTITGDEGGTNLTSAWERNIVITNVKVEPPDFAPSSHPPSPPAVQKSGKAANIRYGGPVIPHRGIPSAVRTFTRRGSRWSPKRRKRPADLPACDYCNTGWRNAAHYKEAHRDMCAFDVGPDGIEVFLGYRCPRANCDREGRLLTTPIAVTNHMKGDCRIKRKPIS